MTREEREDAIDIIQSILDKYEEDECLVTEITIGDGDIKAFRMAIKALEQEPVLDKIRAEIETKYGQCNLTEYIVQYDGVCTSTNDIGDIADILQIIDKYKAEIEPQKSEE